MGDFVWTLSVRLVSVTQPGPLSGQWQEHPKDGARWRSAGQHGSDGFQLTLGEPTAGSAALLAGAAQPGAGRAGQRGDAGSQGGIDDRSELRGVVGRQAADDDLGLF